MPLNVRASICRSQRLEGIHHETKLKIITKIIPVCQYCFSYKTHLKEGFHFELWEQLLEIQLWCSIRIYRNGWGWLDPILEFSNFNWQDRFEWSKVSLNFCWFNFLLQQNIILTETDLIYSVWQKVKRWKLVN